MRGKMLAFLFFISILPLYSLAPEITCHDLVQNCGVPSQNSQSYVVCDDLYFNNHVYGATLNGNCWIQRFSFPSLDNVHFTCNFFPKGARVKLQVCDEGYAPCPYVFFDCERKRRIHLGGVPAWGVALLSIFSFGLAVCLCGFGCKLAGMFHQRRTQLRNQQLNQIPMNFIVPPVVPPVIPLPPLVPMAPQPVVRPPPPLIPAQVPVLPLVQRVGGGQVFVVPPRPAPGNPQLIPLAPPLPFNLLPAAQPQIIHAGFVHNPRLPPPVPVHRVWLSPPRPQVRLPQPQIQLPQPQPQIVQVGGGVQVQPLVNPPPLQPFQPQFFRGQILPAFNMALRNRPGPRGGAQAGNGGGGLGALVAGGQGGGGQARGAPPGVRGRVAGGRRAGRPLWR